MTWQGIDEPPQVAQSQDLHWASSEWAYFGGGDEPSFQLWVLDADATAALSSEPLIVGHKSKGASLMKRLRALLPGLTQKEELPAAAAHVGASMGESVWLVSGFGSADELRTAFKICKGSRIDSLVPDRKADFEAWQRPSHRDPLTRWLQSQAGFSLQRFGAKVSHDPRDPEYPWYIHGPGVYVEPC
jgi:hypothetical protein